jgi:small-conductance mechanosensitive channel
MHQYITDLLKEWGLPAWLWNIIVVLGTVVLGILLSLLLSFFITKKKDETGHYAFFQSLIVHLSKPISILIPLMVFNFFIPFLEMPTIVLTKVQHATEIGLIIVVAWTLIKFLNVLQDLVLHRVNVGLSDNLRQRRIMTQLMYVQRVMVTIIIVLTVGAVLLTFASMRKIGAGLLTGVGVGGIIIGFAAQRSLSNLLAGFQIAFTQPIRIDDQVLVENEFGRIEEITLTYVVVKIWDDRRLILPINYFIEKPFQNWSRTTTEMIGSVYFYVDYTIPIEWVRQQFMEMIKDHPLWDKKVAGVQVTDFKQDVMELRCIVGATSAGEAWDIRCFVREEMIKRITREYPDSLPKSRIIMEQRSAAQGSL